MPVCKKCKQEKTVEEFCKSNYTKIGILLTCKECRNAKCRDAYKDVPAEKKLKRHQEQYEKNKEKVKQSYLRRKHTEAYKNRRRAESKRRRETEKYKKWLEEHKAELKEYHRNYFNRRKRSDPMFALRNQVAGLIKKQLDAGFTKKSKKTRDLLGCSFEEFSAHLGVKPADGYQLDHVCPCSQARNAEELVKLQHYTNFQWLSAEDNKAKLDNRTPEAEEMCRKLLGREWID